MESPVATKASLPLKVAKQIASMVLFTDKKSHVPALQLIKITFDSKITAVATDRYCAAVGQWHYDATDTDSDNHGTVYIDAAAAKFITGLVARPGAVVEFDTEPNGQVRVKYQQYSDYQAMQTVPAFDGKFPAVETLFDDLVVGGVEKISLNVSFLAKLARLIGDDGKKLDQAWNFTYHTGPNPNRPSPVVATNSAYRVLIQPNLPR